MLGKCVCCPFAPVWSRVCVLVYWVVVGEGEESTVIVHNQ